ncbi:lipase ATG15, partial [Tremellales sp. Uapishka_1]
MYIPLISTLTPAFLLPLFQGTPTPPPPLSATLTFQPIHAHAHTWSNHTNSPLLLLHNASTPTDSFLSTPLTLSAADLLDYPDPSILSQPLTIRTIPLSIRRPKIRPPSMTSWGLAAQVRRSRNLHYQGNTTEVWSAPNYEDDSVGAGWEDVEVPAPDIRDRQTLITLAKMTSNAYVTPDSGEWWPVGGWNATMPFGWEDSADGLRGHVFADPTNSTVIISIKGTSAGVLGSGGPTAKNDKFNLGGSVASLIGLSFGAPAVTYEAPGERMAASRLHLPLPPGMPAEKTGVTHVYHTADPIPMGSCTGTYSGCYAAGFALESKCHTGQTILYDTVTVKGWAADVRTHRIGEIINKVLVDPWPGTDGNDSLLGDQYSMEDGGTVHATGRWRNKISSWWGWGRKGPGKGGEKDPEEDDGGWEKHGGVPKAEAEADCVDCFKWEFGDGYKKEPEESKAF